MKMMMMMIGQVEWDGVKSKVRESKFMIGL